MPQGGAPVWNRKVGANNSNNSMVYGRYIELLTISYYGYLFVNQQTSLGGTTLYSINYYYKKHVNCCTYIMINPNPNIPLIHPISETFPTSS